MQKLISIIIPARDGAAHLRQLLDSLAQQLPSAPRTEILVVDDGSQPPLSEQLSGFSGKVLRLEESHGPAHARNVGAGVCEGEILFFLDADVRYAAGALEQAMALFDAHPEIGAVSFLNQPYDAADGLVANFGAAMEHFWHRSLVPEGAAFGDCQGFTTRNGLVRREAFEAIQGFDTRYRTNAHEDYDFGKRLAAQCRAVILASPLLYHAFPTKVARIARNYWVRTSLFVPYFMKFRPPMDTMQITGSEAALRLTAAAPAGLVLLALAPLPAPWWARAALLAAAGGMTGAYAYRIRSFLSACREWSGGSARFVTGACALHLMTSWFILAGGVYGLWRHLRGDVPEDLLSPLR